VPLRFMTLLAWLISSWVSLGSRFAFLTDPVLRLGAA
jgi:hypothetical protein